MNDLKAYVIYYVEQLVGPDSENAYHSLIDAGEAIVPYLIEAFQIETNPSVRSVLVEIVGQCRLPETAEFFSEALADSDPEVWKSALDSLVTLGGPLAIRILEAAKRQFQFTDQARVTQRVEWIDEAIQQTMENEGNCSPYPLTGRFERRTSRFSEDFPAEAGRPMA